MASNPRIDDLRRRLEKDPASRLFAQLAEELRKAGDLDEAIRLSLEGLQRHPNYPSARMTLGRCLLDKNDLMGARREFESVLKGAPDNILAARFLSDCLEGLGDLAGAAAQQREALRLSPGDAQALQRLSDLERKIAAGPLVVAEPTVAEAPHAGQTSDAEPAPIPLAQVDDDAFELERPYEAPTGVATAVEIEPMTTPGAALGRETGAGAVFEFEPADAPLPPAAGAMAPAEAVVPLDVPPAMPPEPPHLDAPSPVSSAQPANAPSAPVPAFRQFEGEPPPPWVTPAPAAPEPERPPVASEEIASSTLAELYFNQGFTDKAVEVYRQVAAREPGNDRARVRLAEIESLIQAAAQPASPTSPPPPPEAHARDAKREGLERAIAGLERMLASVRKE